MTPKRHRLEDYLDGLAAIRHEIEACDTHGQSIPIGDATDNAVQAVEKAKAGGGKVIFLGNGGSAAIASHMAIDYSKNGGVPALCFNDGASLTCLANDLGYDQVFAHQVQSLGKPEDVLIAISSSGKSDNILNGVKSASAIGMYIVTMSGFEATNPLRSKGDCNFFVPSTQYGKVEISHLALCHAFLDLIMNWQPDDPQ